MATMMEVDHYDFSRQRLPRQEAQKNIFKAEASKQIKAMSHKLSTLTLEKENRPLSKHLMKKKKEKERKKKSQNKYKKSMKEEPQSKYPICACCVEYTGKMKRDIDRWAEATRKELRRMFPDWEEKWRKKQELLRKKELEMRLAYEKSLEEKDEGEDEDEDEAEDEDEKEEQEKKQEEKVEEVQVEEQEEGEEEKRERIEEEKRREIEEMCFLCEWVCNMQKQMGHRGRTSPKNPTGHASAAAIISPVCKVNPAVSNTNKQ